MLGRMVSMVDFKDMNLFCPHNNHDTIHRLVPHHHQQNYLTGGWFVGHSGESFSTTQQPRFHFISSTSFSPQNHHWKPTGGWFVGHSGESFSTTQQPRFHFISSRGRLAVSGPSAVTLISNTLESSNNHKHYLEFHWLSSHVKTGW